MESRIKYGAWSSLDPERRYCLMDTMVLMTICRGNDEIMGMVDAVLKDRVLLIIRDVMDEAIGVYGRVDLRGAMVPDSFTSSVRFNFLYRDTEFELVQPEPGTYDSALVTSAEGKYLNENGVPLSYTDCVLLRLVTGHPNIDIMTEDKALRGAVAAELGSQAEGRAHRVMRDYYERRHRTAWFIQGVLNASDAVEWMGVRDGTEYHVDDSWIITIPDSMPPLAGARVQPRSGSGSSSNPFARKPGAMDAISAFFCISERPTYCPCGDPEGRKKFECKCGDARYGDDLDGGLSEGAARRFLYGVPAGTRGRLLSLVRSSDGFYYKLRGKDKPMHWPRLMSTRKP